MDIILNDYSIAGQFNSVDEFVDSLHANTLPIMKIIEKNKYDVFKAYTTYECKLFDDVSINDFIRSNKYNGYPEITALKRFLSTLSDDPYWEDNCKTEQNAVYSCESIGEFKGSEVNCFSEVLERNGVLLSFEHSTYCQHKIHMTKNCINKTIPNAFNQLSLGDYLFSIGQFGFSAYMMSNKYPFEIEFCNKNGRYYADEPYESGELSRTDVNSIQQDFILSLEFISNGILNSRFSDSIKHRNQTYYEFRCSLSNRREFRIYYFRESNKIIYLNALIKKTQKIPEDVKERSVNLINEYIGNKKK